MSFLTARRRLFVLTGATGSTDGSAAYLTPDQLRRVEKLAKSFDVSLGLKRVVSRDWLPEGWARLPDEMRPAWYELYTSRWRLLNPGYYRELLRHVRHAEAVLVVMPLLEGVPTVALSRLMRKPSYVMLVARSFGFRIAEGDRNAFRRLQGRLFVNVAGLFADRILTQGQYLGREFVRPLRRKVIVTLHTSIEPSDFVDLRSRHRDAIELLTVCRLVRTKRVDVTIRALELLVERGIEATLSIVGDGPDREALVEVAARSSVAKRIRFFGYVDPVILRARYRSAFAFVLPSETEGISLALMEAMTAGVPVIATPAGGLAEFLRHEVDSLVIRPDPVDLAAAAERLVHDPKLYVSLAANAQKKMRSVTADGWVNQLRHLVEEGLAERRAR